MILVDFTFDLTEENMAIENSKLVEQIKLTLKKCFGRMTVEVFISENQNEEVDEDNNGLSRTLERNIQIWSINIKAVRQPYKLSGELVQNLLSLLMNDDFACEQFLGVKSNQCWSQSARQIFRINGISFLDHNLRKDGQKIIATVDGTSKVD